MSASNVSFSCVVGFLRKRQLEGQTFEIVLDRFSYWKQGTALNGYKPIQTVPLDCIGVLYVNTAGDLAVCKPGEIQ